MRDQFQRFLLLCVLAMLLFIMLVHYGAVADENGHDPAHVSPRKIQASESHVGDHVYLWGEIVNASENRLIVSTGGRTITITTDNPPGDPSDTVQVFGVIEGERKVAGERILVSNRINLQYLYAVSLIGLVLTIGLFLQSWEIEFRKMQVRPKEVEND